MRQYSILLLSIFLYACASHPPIATGPEKTASYYLPAPQDSPMAELARGRAAAHPGESGVYPVTSAQNALAVRLSAIRAARTSIDIQYFIFRRDETGLLITRELIEAANRGVRVRFLLDDFTTLDADRVLVMLNRHPNIQIRLFNPYPHRGPRLLELLGDFSRLHRRMHNKSLTVDNSITFIGGRNLSNKYFGIDKEHTFGDLDLLAIGDVITPVSRQFDLYWNSEFAYPVHTVIKNTAGSERDFIHELNKNSQDLLTSDYGISVQNSPVIHALENNDSLWYWGRAQALYDAPEKITRLEETEKFRDPSGLMDRLSGAKQQLIIISPYVLPGEAYAEQLIAAAQAGADIHILTNSLSSTDVALVYGAYRKYRKPLLAGGIHLYELPGNLQYKLDNWESSSKSLLHAKAFVIDGKTIYMGSFNMDNRSFQLNTELGLLFESPRLAGEISGNFLQNIRSTAYTLELHNGAIRWRSGDGRVFTRDPGAGLLQKAGAALGAWLPVEPLL